MKYVDIDLLRPGQTSISYRRVNDLLKEFGHKLDQDGGRAWATPKDKAPAILFPDGTYLIDDKHHHTTASRNANAKTFPIEEKLDYSKLTLEEAYQKAYDAGWIYLEPEETLDDIKRSSFPNLKDNPFRWVTDEVKVKVKVERLADGTVASAVAQKTEYPVWVKIKNETKAFEELRKATLLRQKGFLASDKKLTAEEVEKIRAVFLEDSQKSNTLVIPTAEKFEDINWVKLINAHEAKCSFKLL